MHCAASEVLIEANARGLQAALTSGGMETAEVQVRVMGDVFRSVILRNFPGGLKYELRFARPKPFLPVDVGEGIFGRQGLRLCCEYLGGAVRPRTRSPEEAAADYDNDLRETLRGARKKT